MDVASIIGLIVVAAVAVFSSITAPLILSHRTERMHREDLLEEYRRQDEVAAQAKAAAATMLAQQTLAAEAARIRDERSHDLLSRIDVQADRIHTLVNSDMTAARQDQLDQTEATIVVLERVLRVAGEKGIEPDPADVAALDAAKVQRDTLEQILADRLHQLREAEDDMKKTQAGRKLGDQDASRKAGDAPLAAE